MSRQAEILAAGFQHDPLFVQVIPDPARRLRSLTWLMGRFLRLTELRGYTDVLDDAGIALWFPPHVAPFTAGAVVRSGLLGMPFILGPSATFRLWRIFWASDDAATIYAGDWYLFMIAVAENARGSGLGRRLLERGFARADASGAAVRLETNKRENVGFYEHLGLQVVGHQVGHGGLEEWALRRPPAAAR